jgi:hypothetical protein
MGWMAHEHRAAVERPSPRRSGIGATRGDDEAERVGQRREELAEAADLGGEFPSTRCVALSRHAWSVRWASRARFSASPSSSEWMARYLPVGMQVHLTQGLFVEAPPG